MGNLPRAGGLVLDEMGLGEADHEDRAERLGAGESAEDRLHQRDAPGVAATAGVGVAEERLDDLRPEREVPLLHDRQAAIEQGDGVGKLALQTVEIGEAPRGAELAVRVLQLLGEPHGLAAQRGALAERAELGKGLRQPHARADGRVHVELVEALGAELRGQEGDDLAQDLLD